METTAPEYRSLVTEFSEKREKGYNAPTKYDLELVKKDGDRLPVELSISQVNYKGNMSSIAILRDITDRGIVERELVKREAWFSAFMDSASDGFELFDSELNYIKVNQVILDRFNIHEEDVVGKHITELRPHSKDSDEYLKLLRVLETGNSYSRFVSVDSRGLQNLQIKVFKVLDGLGIISSDLSAMVDSEESLRQSEDKYRKLFQNTGEATFIHLMGRRFVEVNDAAVELLGYSKDEFMEMIPNDLSIEDNSAVIPVLVENVVTSRNVTRETTFVAKNGSIIDLETVSQPIQFQGQDAILTVARDITQRKTNEANLRVLNSHASRMAGVTEYEEIYKLTSEAIENVIDVDRVAMGFVEGPNLVYAHFNDVHVPRPIIIPLSARSISTRAIRSGKSQIVNDVTQDPDFISLQVGRVELTKSELIIPIKQDQKVISLLNLGSYRLNAFSENDRALVETLSEHISSAVTRIKQTEQIQESEENLKMFMETSTNGFSILDPDMRLIYINDSRVEMSTNTREALLGKTIQELYSDYDPQGRVAVYNRVLETGKPESYQDLFVYNTSEKIHVIISIFKMGENLGVSTLDISQRTRAEEAVKESEERNRLLKLQADKNQAKLEQELLMERVRTEQELELNKLKTRFMSTATHEIRTPLASIQGYIEILRDIVGDLTGEQLQYFNVIERNVHRLSVLTDDLLDLQRLEEGRISINLEPVNMGNLMEDIVNELSPILAEKDQTLVVNQEDIIVRIDRLRVMQVIVNLLSNASKFSPKGSDILLDISKNEDEVCFKVTDSGLGLAPDDLDKLFTPFPSILVNGNAGGTGLGLSICKGIIDLHHGKIWAESEGNGRGSQFSFTIPSNLS